MSDNLPGRPGLEDRSVASGIASQPQEKLSSADLASDTSHAVGPEKLLGKGGLEVSFEPTGAPLLMGAVQIDDRILVLEHNKTLRDVAIFAPLPEFPEHGRACREFERSSGEMSVFC